ncbi:hypothetical protein TWF788_003014 [Orbilia oligospora]|uniref:lytic cellulose monooxygenase (C4-dehydrogenating) n=1 Tax=Orbilia oligospora TaxID=2813651 RepID=A0A7C8TYU3_ORBOL|nr:hypothetical protein TWF788_003014 [Orbilia oligospora]
MKTTLVTLLSAASTVMGHGIVQEFLIGGQRYTGSLPFQDQYKNPAPERITQAFWENGNSFIDDVTSAEIACNKGAKAAKLVAPAPAGSEITFFWTEWPESHKGPVITYLADCGGDCTTAVGSELNWFKIDEAGLLADGTWAADAVIKNNNSYTLTLPKKIKNGQYLLRHEIIALHAAHEQKGAQFYPSCTNIEITGATGENTPDTVKIPGAYSASDPGIFINIYYPKVESYVIPGPPVYTEDGTSSPNPQVPSSSTPADTSSFPTLVPTATDGVFPTGDFPAGTAGVEETPVVTDSPVPNPTGGYEAPTETETDEEDEPEETAFTTTLVTTIGGQSVTLTATYTTTPPPCYEQDDEEVGVKTVAPVPTVDPVAACSDKTVTVSVTTKEVSTSIVTSIATSVVTSLYTTVVEKTVTVVQGGNVPAQTTVAPNPVTSGIPDYPKPSTFPLGAGFTTIEAPNVPTSVATAEEPSGTGTPLSGYEYALTRRDCDDAFIRCQRSFVGCMKRAKRSGMQTRSCEKFKRDVCVEGFNGCSARV